MPFLKGFSRTSQEKALTGAVQARTAQTWKERALDPIHIYIYTHAYGYYVYIYIYVRVA